MSFSTSILGDINPRESKASPERPSGKAAAWDSIHSSPATTAEAPLREEEENEEREDPIPPRKPNGGIGGFSDRNLRTHWSEAPSAPAPRRSKGSASGVVALLLLVLILGLIWYDRPQLMEDYQYLTHLPSTEQAMKTLEAQATTTEAQLRSLTDNWGSLESKLTKLDRKVSSGFAGARKYVDQEVANAQSQIMAELNQRSDAMNARLDQVESDQAQTKAQLAQAQDQFQKQVNTLQQQVAELQNNTNQNVAKLEQEVGRNQDGLEALGDQLNRKRVDFEVTENHTADIAPGVSLTVLKTNVSYQSFDGFLSLKDEGKTVWLSSAGISRAVSFYPQPTKLPYDLVVTRIGARNVVGYVMVPQAASQG